MKAQMFLVGLGALLVAGNANAAGYEKSVMWSGKHAGYAGAAASSSMGSQSLYFNPAGLAGGENAGDVSLNFSPTSVKLEGNVASADRKEETDHNFSPISALTAAYNVNERFGFGLGAYVVGGSKAIYDSVDLTGNAAAVTAFKPRVATDFAVMEYALGAGYEVIPGLKVGAAWRILKATGSLATIKKTVTDTAFVYVNLADLEDTKYNGFRLGVQYQSPDDVWGVAARYRNSVDFVAESGTNSGNVVTVANSVNAATVSRASVGTSFPSEITVGGNYKLSDSFRLLAGVDYAKYGDNQQLAVTGTITSGLLGGTVALPNIPLNWEDMWNFRLGGEYTGLESVVLRAGYALTTQVTSETAARATITPPGTGHLLTVGAGTSLLGDSLDLDGAFEYAFNSASGSMSATPSGSTTKELLAGVSTETKATVFAVHLGATYKF